MIRPDSSAASGAKSFRKALLVLLLLYVLRPTSAFAPSSSSSSSRVAANVGTTCSRCRSPAFLPSPTSLSASSSTDGDVAASSPTADSDVSEVDRLASLADDLNSAIQKCVPDLLKTCDVAIGLSPSGHRLGLVANRNVNSNDVVLSVPYDDRIVLTPKLATETVWKGILPEGYDGWTGDVGLIATLVLNELAKSSDDGEGGGGIDLPKRDGPATNLMKAWIRSLPTVEELRSLHPLLWSEDDQEILQSSSTRKIYKVLDDVEEDATWLVERIWSVDRKTFPEVATIGGGTTVPCFSAEGFKWAVSIVYSRSVYVDGSLRLIPVMDCANHDDVGTREITGGTMGRFGTTKGAILQTGPTKKIQKGEEIYVSYGPKGPAEYLLEHGFVPEAASSTASAELTFEIDVDSDRFVDDKLDVLEYETYDSAPMEPAQSFDVVSVPGRDGEPDPAMMQFLRLAKLGGTDAFLLESIFRKEVWGFMDMPVSERNEREVLDEIESGCERALAEMDALDSDDSNSSDDDASSSSDESNEAALCQTVRTAERRALTRTIDYVKQERQALDLKEYYQERRLKDLGLDSEWQEGDAEGMGWGGQTRVPGGADYDF